ncbi:hypothetical protein CN285_26485 [Bacillus cereus]|nr:hypothetical protein CN285_26485 [Bacillus cereus]PGM60498.1 hypothetical protein CN947_16890 [Bacillus cereus]
MILNFITIPPKKISNAWIRFYSTLGIVKPSINYLCENIFLLLLPHSYQANKINMTVLMNSLQPGQTCKISNAYVGMTDKVPIHVIIRQLTKEQK